MSFVIFDTEYTTWEGCLQHGWRDNQKKEIVQIAALKVNSDLKVLAELNLLCKPKINPVLSQYFIDLTGIDNNMVTQKGIDFTTAYTCFKNFVKKDVCYSHGWGGTFTDACDGVVIAENLQLNHLPVDDSIQYRNIAPIFKKAYEKNKITVKSQSSGQICKILGLQKQLKDLNLDEHNALYDVYSILCGIRHFKEDFAFLQQKS